MRLARQAGLESALIVVAASILGLLLTRWALRMLAVTAPSEFSGLANTGLEWEVAGFVLLTAACCMLFVGVIPLWPLLQLDLRSLLNTSSHTSSQSSQKVLSGRVITVLSVAVSYALLVAAAVLILHLGVLMRTDPGFEPQHRLTMTISLPQAKHESTIFAEKPDRLYPAVDGRIRLVCRAYSCSCSGNLQYWPVLL